MSAALGDVLMDEQLSAVDSPDIASPEEVRAAIEALMSTEEELARLAVLAKIYVARFPRLNRAGYGPEDLVQEAVKRTLTPGGRHWRRGTKFLAFVAFTMGVNAHVETSIFGQVERTPRALRVSTGMA